MYFFTETHSKSFNLVYLLILLNTSDRMMKVQHSSITISCNTISETLDLQ